MTDSRAALEEAAEKWLDSFGYRLATGPTAAQLANFAEQESSSLKLLLRAMCQDLALMDSGPALTVWGKDGTPYRFPVELDSSGIPVLTPEMIEALKNAAIF